MEELEFYQGQHTGEEIDDAVDTVQLGLKTVNGNDLHGSGNIYVGSEGAQQAADEAAASAAAAQAAAASIDPDTLNARIYAAFPHDTVVGSPATFPDGADGIPVKSLIARIAPAQAGSGTPSPDNPRPIGGWTGLTLRHTGANVYDSAGTAAQNVSSAAVTILGPTSVRVVGKTIGSYPASKQPLTALPLEVGKTYLISANVHITSGTGYFAVRNASNGAVRGSGTITEDGVLRLTYTYGGESDYYLSFFSNFGASGGDVTYSDITVAEGAELSVSWETEAGTVYGGTLDVATGVLTVDWVYAELSGGFDLYSYDNHFFFRSVGVYGAVVNNAIVCDQFPQSAIAGLNTSIGINVVNSNGYNDSRILIRPEGYATMTADQFNAMLASNPIHVAYRVTNPQTYQLAQHEITTMLGGNMFAASPSDVTLVVDYRADPTLYIERINAPADDDMIADTQIAAGKYFIINGNLYLSTTTIPAGDTITPGSNCTITNLADALNALAQ